jgi:hypothetical protein
VPPDGLGAPAEGPVELGDCGFGGTAHLLRIDRATVPIVVGVERDFEHHDPTPS